MKNFPNPLKIFAIVGFAISVIGIFSFSMPETSSKNMKLIVTSNTKSTFDFCIISNEYDKGSKNFEGQTTPFVMDIDSENCKILLKKVSGNSPINFKVKDNIRSIQGNWSTTVILINNEKMESFGL